MSVELEYNGERYMVDGGQWYRRLKVGEVKPEGYQRDDANLGLGWRNGVRVNERVDPQTCEFRVPCVDPRPPFKVGDMVKVARKDEDHSLWHSGREKMVGGYFTVRKIDSDGWLFFEESGYGLLPCLVDLIEEPAKSEDDGHQSVPFKKAGEVQVKFKEAKPLPPRTICDSEPKETAKVMKFSQWQLRPAKEPKTLADVESSREKPVLCWLDDFVIGEFFVDNAGNVFLVSDGGGRVTACDSSRTYKLYKQPSTPAYTLGTLPDYRVVVDKQGLWFRQSHSQWYFSVGSGFGESYLMPSADFTITPYEAYLAEVDLTGGEK